MNARNLRIANWIFFALAFLFFCVSGWFHLRQQIDSSPNNSINAVKGIMIGQVACSMGIAIFIDTIRKEIFGLDPSCVEVRRGGLSALIVSIGLDHLWDMGAYRGIAPTFGMMTINPNAIH